MSQVMQILTYFISLGPKLPEALSIVETMVEAVREGASQLATLFGNPQPLKAGEPVTLTAEEQAKLDECASCCAPDGRGATVKGRLMDLIQLLLANPQLLTLILSLFQK